MDRAFSLQGRPFDSRLYAIPISARTARLFDYLDKLGLDDAPIRGHQPQPVDASCSGDCPVGGVSQDTQ